MNRQYIRLDCSIQFMIWHVTCSAIAMNIIIYATHALSYHRNKLLLVYVLYYINNSIGTKSWLMNRRYIRLECSTQCIEWELFIYITAPDAQRWAKQKGCVVLLWLLWWTYAGSYSSVTWMLTECYLIMAGYICLMVVLVYTSYKVMLARCYNIILYLAGCWPC